MREIKYEYWDEINKVMWKGNQAGEDKNGWNFQQFADGNNQLQGIIYQIIDVGYGPNNGPTETHVLISRQYTGLKDKNGVEIYEGDIYSYTMTIDGSHWNEHKVECSDVVKFEDGAFYHGVHLLSDVIEYDETFTYVGNIYEHPHLLEVVE